jgi:glycosyltransferase involved in cell wall biosynthesis
MKLGSHSQSAGKVVHLVPGVGRQWFGLGAVAVDLMRYQNAEGMNASIWCVDTADEIARVNQSLGLSAAWIRRFEPCRYGFVGYSPRMEREVRCVRSDDRPMVVHLHGIWTGLSRVALKWRERLRTPVVVAAHGALEPWALQRSHWKKKLALAGYESSNLHGASCLQASGEQEICSYREFGLRNPIALIPNGVAESWTKVHGDPAAFRRRHGIPDGTRIMLFVSRITPKKGLPMAIEALHELRRQFQGWLFVIAGIDEFQHQQEVEALTRRLGLVDMIRLIGPVYGDDKRNAFAAAELFLLPTLSEGNPLVVLDALGAGVPVITTKGAPWRDLVRYGCGWWTDISTEAIGRALGDALIMPAAELATLGRRGIDLVIRDYTWSEIARKTIRLYKWLADGGAQPDFVNVI